MNIGRMGPHLLITAKKLERQHPAGRVRSGSHLLRLPYLYQKRVYLPRPIDVRIDPDIQGPPVRTRVGYNRTIDTVLPRIQCQQRGISNINT